MPKKDKAEEIEEAPAPGAAAERLAVETWATRKGLLPMMLDGSEATLPAGTTGDRYGGVKVSMARLRAPSVNPDYWRFAAARARSRWPEGCEVTEAEFDAAVKAATEDHVIR